MNIEHCVATSADLPQIADLGWNLRVDDELVSDRGAYERFIADFVRVCQTEWSPTEIIHWTAANGKKVLAVMSIALVRKLPSPDNLRTGGVFYPKCATLVWRVVC